MKLNHIKRNAFNSIFKVFLVLMFLVAIFSCGYTPTTPIQKLLSNPRAYSNCNVKVSGDVIEISNLFIIKYFVIRDKTGEITVVTEQPLPKKGEQIDVTGTIKEAFSIGDAQLIVLVESNNK